MFTPTFFSMGDKSKILFPGTGFSNPGNSKEMSSWGVPMGPWRPFGSFQGIKSYFDSHNDNEGFIKNITFKKKYLYSKSMFASFKTCFSPQDFKTL